MYTCRDYKSLFAYHVSVETPLSQRPCCTYTRSPPIKERGGTRGRRKTVQKVLPNVVSNWPKTNAEAFWQRLSLEDGQGGEDACGEDGCGEDGCGEDCCGCRHIETLQWPPGACSQSSVTPSSCQSLSWNLPPKEKTPYTNGLHWSSQTSPPFMEGTITACPSTSH